MLSPNPTSRPHLFLPSSIVFHAFIRNKDAIKNVPPLEEGLLLTVYHLVQHCSNSVGEDFNNDSIGGRDEANGPKVLYTKSFRLLWNESNEGRIKTYSYLPIQMEFVE